MSHEIVHTIGSTTYFIFILLFLWSISIPKANPGSGWWAASVSFALIARLSMLLLLTESSTRLAIALYIFFNVLEKPCLFTGLTRFLNFKIHPAKIWIPALAAEIWLLIALVADFTPLARSLGYSVINAGFMIAMVWLIVTTRTSFPGWPLMSVAAATSALALHWLASPFLVHLYPSWFRNAFLLGTTLVLIQYLSLLAAVLALLHTRLIDAEAKALDLAYLDPLTGLNNRRYMTTLFDHALILATRPHQLVAVLYIDLDNFKPINDAAGHAAGDEVLRTVGSRLKSITRSTDICARVGGDEFVVIATQLENEQQGTEIAGKLLSQITKIIPVEGQNFTLGASIGICFYPKHGSDLASLVESADKAMYNVKQKGKSGWLVFDPTRHTDTPNR